MYQVIDDRNTNQYKYQEKDKYHWKKDNKLLMNLE